MVSSLGKLRAGPQKEHLRVPRVFYGIQALRAIAALLVVIEHSIYLWLTRIISRQNPTFWMNGAAGVDIFFVISGFVMTVSMPGLWRYTHPIRIFLQRRITRIVPLYWLATTLKLILLVIAPGLALHRTLTIQNTIGSYLFWPVRNAAGEIAPIIVVGWTLNFEMFFYLVFSLAMLFKGRTVGFLGLSILLIAAIGIIHQPSWPLIFVLASPLLLEFLFGVAIARFATTGYQPNHSLSWAILGLGLLGILTLFPHLPLEPDLGQWRFLLWGVPAGAIVFGAVALEGVLSKSLPGWLISLGDASYAIYLSQTFVLPVVEIIIKKISLKGVPALVGCVLGGLVFSALVGKIVHRFVEQPILKLLKDKQRVGGAIATGVQVAKR